MIIKEESILQNLPRQELSEKEIIIVESIVHLITIIDISYNRLFSILLSNQEKLATEMPMIDVWNIIDTSHRLRCLLEIMPGIKRNLPWFQLTLRGLKKTEDIRHFIQHFNREIDDLITNVKPLLGHLSWVEILEDNKFKITMIVPGNLRTFKNLSVINPAGSNIRNKIDLITFCIGDNKLSISDIFYSLIDLVTELEKHIENKRA
jgi:hypothetical protein